MLDIFRDKTISALSELLAYITIVIYGLIYVRFGNLADSPINSDPIAIVFFALLFAVVLTEIFPKIKTLSGQYFLYYPIWLSAGLLFSISSLSHPVALISSKIGFPLCAGVLIWKIYTIVRSRR